MPLTGTPSTPTYDQDRRMIGVWMREPGTVGPVNAVRVFITIEAVWTLDPSALRDVYAALEVFGAHRAKVELAAEPHVR